MSSADIPAKVPTETAGGKETTGSVPVSVRFPDPRLEKLVRTAAVEADTSRSEFIVAASITAARDVLKLKRESDFQRWLEERAA
jgi:uncharacterized protein (DUF1778 family)